MKEKSNDASPHGLTTGSYVTGAIADPAIKSRDDGYFYFPLELKMADYDG